jgi:hypothetical protein
MTDKELQEQIADKLWKLKYPRGTAWEQLFDGMNDSNKAKFRKKADSIIGLIRSNPDWIESEAKKLGMVKQPDNSIGISIDNYADSED